MTETRYRVLIPPGWVMISVADGRSQINELVEREFAGLPNDSYGPRKRMLRDSLADLLASAQESGGIDLLFPLGSLWAVPVSAGVIMSEHRAQAPSNAAVSDLLAAIRADQPGSETVPTTAGDSIREVHEESTVSDVDGPQRLRTVHYTWPVPRGGGNLLIGSLSITGEATDEYAPIVEALTELFDVMMQSLQWRTVDEPSVEPEQTAADRNATEQDGSEQSASEPTESTS